MKIKLVFLDWNLKGKSVYSTEVGNELSKGPFHSGTTFMGEIELSEEDRMELKIAIQAGYQPCFWIGAFGNEIKLKSVPNVEAMNMTLLIQEEQKIITDLLNAAVRMRSATGEDYEDRSENEEGEAWNQLDMAIRKAESLIKKWR